MVCYKINIDSTEIYIPKYQTSLDLNLIPELYNRLATLDIGVLELTKIYKQVTKKYRTVYMGFTDGNNKYDTVLVLIPEYLLDKYKRITVILEDIKRIKFYNKLEENIKLANKVIKDNLKNRTNINRYINLKILINSLIVSEFMKLNGIENYQLKYEKVNDIITFIKISELKLIRLDPV